MNAKPCRPERHSPGWQRHWAAAPWPGGSHVGRFTQSDPLGVNPYEPYTWDEYAYAGNSPELRQGEVGMPPLSAGSLVHLVLAQAGPSPSGDGVPNSDGTSARVHRRCGRRQRVRQEVELRRSPYFQEFAHCLDVSRLYSATAAYYYNDDFRVDARFVPGIGLPAVSRGSASPVRYAVARPPAIAPAQPARTAPGATVPAPLGTLGGA
jgi:hypothetical protein